MVSNDRHRSTETHDRSDDPVADRNATSSDRPTDDAALGRRSVLTGVTGLAASGVAVGSASAQAADVPEPEIEGPIEGGSRTGGPQTAAPHDVEAYGYTEEEYFFSGTAQEDSAFGGFSWFTDEADYKTRALVYRPVDESAFNGHLLVDWMNVTTGTDVPVTWANAYDYLMREGYAVAAVSAQAVGVDNAPEDGELVSEGVEDLVSWDPERYGDLTHPGDEFALDMFSQIVEGLRSGGSSNDTWWGGGSDGVDPLEGLDVEYVIATGQSQSAGYMADLIDDVQSEYGNIDGYLPAASVVPDISDDLVPVLWLNTENEAESLFGFLGGEPPADSGQFRLWEVAGASHVNYWLSAWAQAMNARDFHGEPLEWDPAAAGNFGERVDGEYGDCQGNYFPARHAYSAALEALRGWVEDGTAPDSAPRIERDGDGGLVRDEFGNAVGGVRLPPIDVPVATYDGASCLLEGETRQLADDTLENQYDSDDDYLAQFEAAAAESVANGHLLKADAAELIGRAEDADVVDDGDDSSDYWWF